MQGVRRRLLSLIQSSANFRLAGQDGREGGGRDDVRLPAYSTLKDVNGSLRQSSSRTGMVRRDMQVNLAHFLLLSQNSLVRIEVPCRINLARWDILSHGGRTLPYLAYGLSVLPWLIKRIPQLSREQIYFGLRHFWYDTALAAGPQTMESLTRVAVPERILFGTDFPYTSVEAVADQVQSLEGQESISATQRASIVRGNVLALFPRLVNLLGTQCLCLKSAVIDVNSKSRPL